jgi:peptidoglycan/LPS O-acetylase OafA/YrhL
VRATLHRQIVVKLELERIVAHRTAPPPAVEPPPPAMQADPRPADVDAAFSGRYLPELESIRGIAALLVLVFHLDGFVAAGRNAMVPEYVSVAWAFVRAGDTGVSLFFVLSAFLLSMPFLRAAAGEGRVDIGNYLSRRILRIVPLYYASVAAGIALTWSTPKQAWRHLAYFAFPSGFTAWTEPMLPFSNVWWSLRTETQFYLLLPILAVVLARRRAVVVACAVYALVYTIYLLDWYRPLTVNGALTLSSSLFGRSPLFVCGIAASAVYLRFGDQLREWLAANRFFRGGGSDAAMMLLLAALGLTLQWSISIGAVRSYVPPGSAFHVVEGIVWSVVVLLVLVAPLRLKGLLHNRAFEHVGVLSYSIYMVHVPVFATFLWLQHNGYCSRVWSPGTAAIAAAMLAAVYLLSRLTYRFIEQPFLRRKRHVPLNAGAGSVTSVRVARIRRSSVERMRLP